MCEFREVLGNGAEPPVLTLTERNGFMPQADRFRKRLATADTSKYKVVRRHDIAFNPYLLWAGALAQNTICDVGVISPLYPTFRVREGLDPRFVGRLLLAPAVVLKYDSIAFGSVPRRRRSSVEDFLDLEIPAPPPLDEQERIADVLDTTDALRARRGATIARLPALSEAAFASLFGPDEAIMERWPVVPFESTLLSPLRNGVSPSKRGQFQARVLSLAAVTGSAFDRSAAKESTFSSAHAPDKTVDRRDFLICRGNGNLALVGRAKFPDADLAEVAFPDTMIAARLDANALTREYIAHLWDRPVIRRQVEKLARTTNGTHKINQSMIESIQIPLPPLESQLRLDRVQDAIRSNRRRFVDSAYKLNRLFESLQQDAFQDAI